MKNGVRRVRDAAMAGLCLAWLASACGPSENAPDASWDATTGRLDGGASDGSAADGSPADGGPADGGPSDGGARVDSSIEVTPVTAACIARCELCVAPLLAPDDPTCFDMCVGEARFLERAGCSAELEASTTCDATEACDSGCLDPLVAILDCADASETEPCTTRYRTCFDISCFATCLAYDVGAVATGCVAEYDSFSSCERAHVAEDCAEAPPTICMPAWDAFNACRDAWIATHF